jgi:hypothetical protein
MWPARLDAPETTQSLTTELRRRGVQIAAKGLRYRQQQRLLWPLLEVVEKSVRQPVGPLHEPRPTSTPGFRLRAAQSEGRVRDAQVDDSDIRFNGRTLT